MRVRLFFSLTALILAASSGVIGQQGDTSAPRQRPLFRSSQNLILVDVTVRDRKGQPIEGLTAADFEVLENGKAQDVVSFAYEKVAPSKATIVTASTLSKAGEGKGAVPVTIGSTKPATATAPTAPATPAAAADDAAKIDASMMPLTSDEVAGHRVWILLFDTSSMQPEDVQKAADAAIKWSTDKMSTSDLVAVAAISSTLQILTDFTNDKAKITSTLKAFAVTDGTAVADVDASTMSTDETTATSTTDVTTVDSSTQELDSFNNDMRLRGLKTICDSLVSIQQHKAILYFSSGMNRNGSDNAVESRAAVNACSRANTSINPVDSRGLQVVVAGGSARQGSRGGVGAFSGRGVAQQFAQLASQQETLQSLASDTGGQAFTDSNDFGEAFTAVEKEISSYYILGYSSTNTKQDGSFRKIQVRLKSKIDAKLASRDGYYADRDFANTGKGDRENALQEQLLMPIPATDVPLFVTAGYFRLPTADACGNQVDFGGRGGPGGPGGRGGRGAGPGGGGPGGPGGFGFTPTCYYVPISVAVPGEAVPVSSTNEVMDVRGFIKDERGETFATIKSTINVPASTKESLAQKQVLFQTGATLPPGRYTAKIIVRENTTGQMGTFETPVVVPDLSRSSVKLSTVVLSTQLANATGRKTLSPLVRDNIEIVPNLTRVVNQDQKLYFYYEVYDPSTGPTPGGAPQVRTNLAFYRNKTKVYETPIVEHNAFDALDRKAAIFEFALDAGTLKPGVYTCQVNVVDAVAGAVTFQRFQMAVRPSAKADGGR